MESGIWVNAEQARSKAEATIKAIKLERWRRYMRGYRYWKNKPTFILHKKRSYKNIKACLIAEEARSRASMYAWGDLGTCRRVLRACKWPPEDGKIFLTLDDVRAIS